MIWVLSADRVEAKFVQQQLRKAGHKVCTPMHKPPYHVSMVLFGRSVPLEKQQQLQATYEKVYELTADKQGVQLGSGLPYDVKIKLHC